MINKNLISQSVNGSSSEDNVLSLLRLHPSVNNHPIVQELISMYESDKSRNNKSSESVSLARYLAMALILIIEGDGE